MMKKYFKFFFLLILSFFTVSVYAAEANFIIMIDAGSSGSRLHLFQYKNNKAIPKIKDISSQPKVNPGLSSFADHPERAGESLKGLLDNAAELLKKKDIDQRTVSVNILATAGMRLLPAESQEAIYAEVKKYIRANYSFSLGQIETITGQMEGLYGWLDVNYLLENFSAHTPTVGSVDMGGASTQIAFATRETIKTEDTFKIEMDGQSYIVFSKSFLGFGLDQARKAMTSSALAGSCFPAGYEFSPKDSGYFNLGSCKQEYGNLLKTHAVAAQIPSTKNMRFVAYSGIYSIYKFFNMDKNPDKFAMEARLNEVCTKNWEQLKLEYPTEKYLSTVCADASYENELLYNTYQLHSEQLVVASKLNEKEIDWTLGALLYRLMNK